MDITFLHCPGCQQGRASGTGTLKHVHCVPAPQQTLRNLLGFFFFAFFFSVFLRLGVRGLDVQDLGGTATPGQRLEMGPRNKNIFIFVSKPRCAPAFFSAHHCNSRAVGTAPQHVCVWKWGPEPKRALGWGCSITFSVPLWQEAPVDPLPGSSPRTPSLKGRGMFIIVLVIKAVVVNCSLPLVIRRERIKYGYIGLSSLPVT